MSEHVHDCTGPDMTCPCGYVFRVPPVSVSIEVFDGQRKVFSDAYNCETIDGAIAGLERAIRKLQKVALALCALLFAATADAGPITATASGCVTEAADFTWIGEDFLFMVFHDDTAGCEPTTRTNTRGLHLESTTIEGFRVDAPAFLIAGGCGRFQFDAHVRIPGGLSQAPGGLQALVYDTGIDCAPSRYVPRQPESPVSVPDSGSSLLLGGLSVMILRAATIRESFARLTYAAKTETDRP